MDDLLDQNAVGNKQNLIIYEQTINDVYFNKKLLLSLTTRLLSVGIATAIFLAIALTLYNKEIAVFSEIAALFQKARTNVTLLIFMVMSCIIFGAVLVLYMYFLRELIQVSLDYTNKKVICYDTFIEDKQYIEDADSKYRIILMHIVDNKSEYKVSKEAFNILEKGDKVSILLSAHAKIFLKVQI